MVAEPQEGKRIADQKKKSGKRRGNRYQGGKLDMREGAEAVRRKKSMYRITVGNRVKGAR